MTFEMGLWRVDDGQPRKLSAMGIPREQQLEDMLVNDPTTLGERLLIIGRQVTTTFGSIVDILAIDVDGDLHVLELKRNKTPREVVAQALDYGSWVNGLGHQQVREFFALPPPRGRARGGLHRSLRHKPARRAQHCAPPNHHRSGD